MRKALTVGILREIKQGERRTPLVPSHVGWLVKRGIKVEVESNPLRVYSDRAYKESGAKVVDRIKKANLLVGIKEPFLNNLSASKIYMIFSHTIKGQSYNMPLLKAFLKRKITLLDYERIVDAEDRRLVYFGRFAGICGVVDSLHYLGKRLEREGIRGHPFFLLSRAHQYSSLGELKQSVLQLKHWIRKHGFDKRISPFIIGITGHGRVSQGAQEILDLLEPIEIHPKDMAGFIKQHKWAHKKIYKIVFLREEKIRSKIGKGFYFEDYLQFPELFESNLDLYLTHLNIFIHASYWDTRFPRMITKEMIHKLIKAKRFRLKFIGDISCDIEGAVELTYKTSSSLSENPIFTYDPEKEKFFDGLKSEGITILAVDNLPTELPKDASLEFSQLIRDYVYQIAAHGVKDITNHAAIPRELRRAIIAQGGKLTADYRYLNKFLKRR